MDKKTIISNMKKLIVLVVLCCLHNFMYSQDIDSLITIKGYYVTAITKQDVEFSYEQQIKRAEGKSFSTPIDYKQSSFFVPMQVGNKIVCDKDIVLGKFLKNEQNDSIYVIPNANNIGTLKAIKIVQKDISKETYILSNALLLSPFYEICGNDNFLFRCTYIEGFARYKHIKDIEKEWQNYLLNICFIDKKMENAKFFFIVKINNYTPYIEVPKLKKWLPYTLSSP